MIETVAHRSAPIVTPAPAQSAAIPARMRVRVVSTSDELESLSDTWSLLHSSGESTAFQSFEWVRAWWRHFGEPNPRLTLHVVVLEEMGETVAIAPCVISRARAFGVVGLAQLELLGKGITDYLDVLIRPGFEGRACENLADHIAGSRLFELVSFVDVPDGSAVRRLLMPALAQRGWTQTASVREQCPRTRLLESWPATLASLEDSHRKRVAYLDRKLRKNFAVDVQRVESEAALDEAFPDFMQMHQRRWTSAGEPGAFADARAVAFHREVSRAFLRRGWLSLSFLKLDGRTACANYSFRVGGKLEFYLSGSADFEAVRKFAPGILLHVYCVQQAIAEGAQVYDFLRGTERYKYELGAQDVPNWSLLAFPPGAGLTRLKHRLHGLQRKAEARVKLAMARANREKV